MNKKFWKKVSHELTDNHTHDPFDDSQFVMDDDMSQKVSCDGCNRSVKAQTGNPHLPDRGLLFPFQDVGYYGGFTDNEPWEKERQEPFKLCHDCVVNVLNAVPELAKKITPGHHPSPTQEAPCCNWAWSWVKDEDGKNITVHADGNGGWKIAEDQGDE